MLHLILGTAGTGKSTLLTQRIEQDVAQNKRAYLIIPEQQANLSERTMLPHLPERAGLTFSITGFTRLYDRVASRHGGISTSAPDRALGLLLLWQCLRELSPVLEWEKSNILLSAGGYARMTTLQTGELVATYEHGGIKLAKSTNDGKGWINPVSVTKPAKTPLGAFESNNIDNDISEVLKVLEDF